MIDQTLSVRNLTSTRIELKLIERFAASTNVDTTSTIGTISRSLTSFLRSPTASTVPSSPSATQLAANTETFSLEDVDIGINPFTTCKTGIKPAGSKANETLRLTFENNGERYRVDTSASASRSTSLTPLTPKPHFQYTSIYLPQHSHLTISSSADPQGWMNELKDETPLSALSIPGTHNSPACYRALPSVRCQAVSPRIQLENGVRFFDVRVQPESPPDVSKDGLILVHSAFPISMLGRNYFRDLVNEIIGFLDKNPSETLILSVKREGTGDATDAQLSRILKDHYANGRWFTAPHIPTLAEARGKIVLIRRFRLDESLQAENGGAGWGINAEIWKDNTSCDTCPSGDICVQDFYEVLEPESIEKKITYCEAHLDRAGASVCKLTSLASPQVTGNCPPQDKQPLFLNFLSASNFWKVGCWPERIAAKINPAIIDYLCRKHDEPNGDKHLGDGATGIVVCDWVGTNGDWDLVKCIVGMNSKLEMREKGT